MSRYMILHYIRLSCILLCLYYVVLYHIVFSCIKVSALLDASSKSRASPANAAPSLHDVLNLAHLCTHISYLSIHIYIYTYIHTHIPKYTRERPGARGGRDLLLSGLPEHQALQLSQREVLLRRHLLQETTKDNSRNLLKSCGALAEYESKLT